MPTRTGQDRARAENNFQVERAAQGDEKGSVSPTACTIDRVLANGDRGRRRGREKERDRGKSLSARKNALYEPGTRAIRRAFSFTSLYFLPCYVSLAGYIILSLFTLSFHAGRVHMGSFKYEHP